MELLAFGRRKLTHLWLISDDGVDLLIWGNAEVATTIMAASIPVLRVLIRDVAAAATTGHYYSFSNNNTKRRRKGTSVTGGNSTAVDSAIQNVIIHSPVGGDGESGKSILEGGERKERKESSRGIVQTTEVRIQFSDASLDDGHNGDDFEMRTLNRLA